MQAKVSMEEFNLEVAVDFANDCISKTTGKGLSNPERMVFQEAWNDLTYLEIAERHSYSQAYLNNDIGFHLWKKLSESTGKSLRMRKFKAPLYEYWLECKGKVFVELSAVEKSNIPYPDAGERVDSSLYIKPKEYEQICSDLIQEGALVRIRAPKSMGKTSLMNRLIVYAQQQGFKTVRLDIDAVDHEIFTSVESLLRWLCGKVSLQLDLENRVESYWTGSLGNTDKCSDYFETYLLSNLEEPLLIAFDKVDRFFVEDKKVIDDFFGLLRSWYERAKTNELWAQLHILIAHSTELYVPMDMNNSPFNIGIPVKLEDLEQWDVQELVRLHGLILSEIQQLMGLVGGHPHLIRLALYSAVQKSLSVTEIVRIAGSDVGVFASHLRGLMKLLYEYPELTKAYKAVILASEPVDVTYPLGFKLESLGLVRQHEKGFTPSYELYRQYFSRALKESLG
jgi:hypothetical protein